MPLGAPHSVDEVAAAVRRRGIRSMKKAADIKYPHSANLFQFCRRVLDHKFGGIRVIDQDVGQILGFDPADCSHWKKGKKNIRSVQAMKAIAEHLGVDEKLVVDVATGDLDDTEAFFEYSGYGSFQIDPKILELAKKEFYRRHAGSWTKDKENEFRDAFSVNEPAIDRLVEAVHQRLNFQEAPLYLPEVVAAYPELRLVATETPAPAPTKDGKETGTRESATANGRAQPFPAVTVTRDGATTTVTYVAGAEVRPFMRYRIARAMAGHFLQALEPKADSVAATPGSSEYSQHVAEVQANLFAAKLLAPANLLRREMGQVNVAKDVVAQLAEIFWVSKTFMNRRLKDILQSATAL
jgi:hypothetical protein